MLTAGPTCKLVRHLGTAQAGRAPHRSPHHACRCTEDGAASPAAEPLIKWLLDRGGAVQNVAVTECSAEDGSSMGLGLVATADAAQGDVLIEVPSECYLNHKTGHGSPALQKLIDFMPDDLSLSVQIVCERARGADSSFAAYVEQLPSELANMPLFFSDALLQELQSPHIEMQARQMRNFLQATAEQVIPAVLKECSEGDDPFCGATIGIDDLCWGLMILYSRTVSLQAGDCLIPLLDFSNHDSRSPNTAPTSSTRGTRLVTTKPVAAGDQLLWSYGDRPNHEFLAYYGFIMEDNPYDKVAIPFDLELLEAGAREAGEPWPATPPQFWQQEYLADLGLLPDADGVAPEVFFGSQERIDVNMLAAAMALCCSHPSESIPSGSARKGGVQELCKRGEAAAKALRVMGGIAKLKLGEYPTTVEEDQALLDKGGLRESVLLAVRFRMGQKRILRGAADFITERLGQLNVVKPS